MIGSNDRKDWSDMIDKKRVVDDSDDDDPSEIGSSEHGTSEASGEHEIHSNDKPVKEVIAKRETKVVWCLKSAVFMVLVCSALGVALATFYYVKGSENEQFKDKFSDDAHKIFESIGSSIDKTLGIFDSLSVTMVSSARASGETWPFVTLPDFGIRLSKLLPLSNAVAISVIPIVQPQQRKKWEAYSIAHDSWVNESLAVQETWDNFYGSVNYGWEPYGVIYGDVDDIPYSVKRPLLPLWQNFPSVPSVTYNWDWYSVLEVGSLDSCMQNHVAVVSDAYMIPTPNDPVAQAETEAWESWFREYLPPWEEAVEPVSDIFYPIVEDLSHVQLNDGEGYNPDEHKIVGILAAAMYWRETLKNILPDDSHGIDIVFQNPCTEAFSYRINGPNTTYLGVGDRHDTRYDHMEKAKNLTDLGTYSKAYSGVPLDTNYCPFTLHIYPSSVMEANHTTDNRIIFTVAAVLIFAFTSLVFFLYDVTVERRQQIVMRTAVRSSAIVSSLFPEDVRDRIYDAGQQEDGNSRVNLLSYASNNKAAQNLEVNQDKAGMFSSDPIAELYPDTTVLFADIAGFTAWSSERQAVEVFRLLESLYHAFDVIAKQRGVFKVETIGDSYVAVVGLPTPRDHHAMVMARFARDIRQKMVEVVHELEKALGPGTADLALRIGLNSGPTTAGVLRGEKSRFQLFGDTVNTAARMESNGERNKIQVSQKTADLITASGKGHWLTPRLEKVNAKGKGMLQTFWCEPRAGGGSQAETSLSGGDHESASAEDVAFVADDRVARLVDWHVDVFLGIMQGMKAHEVDKPQAVSLVGSDTSGNVMPRDEVADLLVPPKTDSCPLDPSHEVVITQPVKDQLRGLIESIAEKYSSANAFHTFAHCSHVVLSAKKLLDKIAVCEDDSSTKQQVFAMVTDPLIQFAVLFAALIHDVDHPGVSNAQQVKEQTAVSLTFAGKSVAEQHSITTAWGILMEPKYSDLRGFLFSSADDLRRFRQVVVNAVMATDLFDAELKQMREDRWQKSQWSDLDAPHGNKDELACSRASSIVDLIVQAADVSHTMQHFAIYKQWNMRLLEEMYHAYTSGRAEKDPTMGWYDGELWFYDNYVIPLAQKLKTSGMFGTLGDEFLGYARDNRLEWEASGRDIVFEATK